VEQVHPSLLLESAGTNFW